MSQVRKPIEALEIGEWASYSSGDHAYNVERTDEESWAIHRLRGGILQSTLTLSNATTAEVENLTWSWRDVNETYGKGSTYEARRIRRLLAGEEA